MLRPLLRSIVVVGIVAAMVQCAPERTQPDTRLSPITSPDRGDQCADGLSADDLTRLFATPMERFGGGDYQRATRLPDDRVLWTFQDSFVDGEFVHNAGLVQSGRCFTVLNGDRTAWLLSADTSPREHWYWPLGAAPNADGRRATVFVAEMVETGTAYLERPRPTAVHRVEVALDTMEVVEVFAEPSTLPDLYGWSVTDDGQHSYLYSHCAAQFGYDGILGFDPCVEYVNVARSPVGYFGAPREYWTEDGWSPDPTLAVPVVDGSFVGSGNNPAQIRFDGAGFALVEKPDDWFGDRVEFGYGDEPQGPFRHTGSANAALACEATVCNSYFATWIPWSDPDGSSIWAISCNVWDGDRTCDQLDRYGPRFATADTGAS